MLAIRVVRLGFVRAAGGTGPGPVYPGSYRQSGAALDLEWVGQSVAGAWHADATIVADTLSVRYNAIMQLTDFEDAVYTRAS